MQVDARLQRTLLWLAVAVPATCVFGYFGWPTPWRYDRLTLGDKTYPVRTHRVSERAEMFTNDGWERVGGGADAPSVSRPAVKLTPEEVGAIQGTMNITSEGKLHFDLHNGTERELIELQVDVFIGPIGNVEATRRRYKIPVSLGKPFSAVFLYVPCGCKVRSGETYTWQFVGAIGS